MATEDGAIGEAAEPEQQEEEEEAPVRRRRRSVSPGPRMGRGRAGKAFLMHLIQIQNFAA